MDVETILRLAFVAANVDSLAYLAVLPCKIDCSHAIIFYSCILKRPFEFRRVVSALKILEV